MKIEQVIAIDKLENRLTDLLDRGEITARDLRAFGYLLDLAGLEHDERKAFMGPAPFRTLAEIEDDFKVSPQDAARLREGETS